jgi:hypothetical protein
MLDDPNNKSKVDLLIGLLTRSEQYTSISLPTEPYLIRVLLASLSLENKLRKRGLRGLN